jgi:hypothetical protein
LTSSTSSSLSTTSRRDKIHVWRLHAFCKSCHAPFFSELCWFFFRFTFLCCIWILIVNCKLLTATSFFYSEPLCIDMSLCYLKEVHRVTE